MPFTPTTAESFENFMNLIWEGDDPQSLDPADHRLFWETYGQCHDATRMALAFGWTRGPSILCHGTPSHIWAHGTESIIIFDNGAGITADLPVTSH